MTTSYEQRDKELEDESVKLILEAIQHGSATVNAVRQNLENDQRNVYARQSLKLGTDSELRDLQYRIRVRERVLEVAEQEKRARA